MIVQRPLSMHDGSPAMQVVDEIPGDAVSVDFLPDIRSRWSILTTPLRLNGGAALAAPCFMSRLEALFPWHDGLIGFVAREMLLARGCGYQAMSLPAVILVGPPGAGKTHAARTVAAEIGLGFAMLDAGGSSDNRVLSGTARGFNGSTPAWPLITIAALSTGNPLLLIDEIDKAGGSNQNGHIHHTLLAMTEPSTSRAWYDSCLLAPADLSAVSWVFCANNLSSIPRPLRSRIEVIEMPAPAAKWSGHIVERIAADLVVQMGLPPPAAGLLLRCSNVKNTAVAVHRGGGSLRDLRRLLRSALADHVRGIRRRLDH